MKQEDKELLLKDLCGRLPYGVIIQEKCIENDKTFLPHAENNKLVNIDVHEDLAITSGGSRYYIEEFKPYLFPLSSMTEEQESYLHFNTKFSITRFGNLIIKTDEDDYPYVVDEDDWLNLFDWFNKNHFDYRGLILKGLALDATGLNIY